MKIRDIKLNKRDIRCNSQTMFNRLTRALQRAILNQFKLVIQPRKNRSVFIAKEFRGQMIPLFRQEYNVIKCRHCKQFAKANQGFRFKCIQCSTISNIESEDPQWTAWKNIPS